MTTAGTPSVGAGGNGNADWAGLSTRERILRAASTLFATRGYGGTSTREIATLVDIRQPSLFHHFPSKASIAEALLDHSLGRVAEPVAQLARDGGSAAARLYGYVYFDTRFLATSPYDLAGLYSDDILNAPELADWRRRLDALHDAIADLVRQGIDGGEFVPIDPDFAQRVISGLNLITISMHHGQSAAWAAQFADDVATFALRGLIAALSDLPRARRDGVAIADRLGHATV